MKHPHVFRISIWILSLLNVLAAFFIWLPSATGGVTTYVLFPLFGIVAFGLMWSHYVSDALRRYFGLSDDVLNSHFRLTSYLVLFCILVHPFLLEFQLYLDGLGLPPGSLLAAYRGGVERLAILLGVVALTCFLAFELHRLFKDRNWWKYVEWANIAAMGLILWHGFTLGGELRTPWFQIVWVLYTVTFAVAVAYTGYHKRRIDHGRKEYA